MEGIIPFFIILLAALFSSQIFSRLHVPWIVGLILAGMLIGPFGLEIYTPNETIEFLGEIGLILLMFMVGLEIKLSSLKTLGKSIALITFVNGGIPFLIGVLIGQLFGFGIITSLFIGIIFISSSVAVIIPSLEAMGLLRKKVGKLIVGSSILEEIVSLILFSILLQSVNPSTSMPLYFFYPLIIIVIIVLRWLIVRMHSVLEFRSVGGDIFQGELRSIFAIIFGTVVVFELLGLHPIIASFFVGLILSESITGDVFREKLKTISYGLFIPIFFIVIGTKTNFSVFNDLTSGLYLILAIVLGSILFKLLSGIFAGRLAGLSFKDSILLGVTKVPRLTTTLAVAFAGLELGILDQGLVAAMITLSIISTFAGPFLIRLILFASNSSATNKASRS